MATRKTSKPSALKPTKKSADAKAAPWDRENPKGEHEHHDLSPKAKASAKASAKKAGRPYPNLVDNMRAAREEEK